VHVEKSKDLAKNRKAKKSHQKKKGGKGKGTVPSKLTKYRGNLLRGKILIYKGGNAGPIKSRGDD